MSALNVRRDAPREVYRNVTAGVPIATYEWLDRKAREDGVPLATIVREAIDNYRVKAGE